MITPHHIEQTHQFMAALAATCRDRRLPLPTIREVQLAQRHGRTFSFAIFPEAVGGKLEAYQQAGFLHQLSTTLKGQPVTYSNHTGFRLVAVIQDVCEALPARLTRLNTCPTVYDWGATMPFKRSRSRGRSSGMA